MFDLRSFRLDHRMTQKDIASLFKCTQVYVSLLESRKKTVSTDQMNILISNYGEDEVMRYNVDNNEDKKEPEYRHKDIIPYSPTQKTSEKSNDMYEIVMKQMELIKTQSEQISKFQEQIGDMITIIKEKL